MEFLLKVIVNSVSVKSKTLCYVREAAVFSDCFAV